MPVVRRKMTAATAVNHTPTDFPQDPNITSSSSRGADGFSSYKHTQLAKFLISPFQQFGNWNLRNLLESVAQRFTKIRGNEIIVPMRTPLRLWYTLVHNSEFQQLLSTYLERL